MNNYHSMTIIGAKAHALHAATYLFLASFLSVETAENALAGTICPAGNGVNPFPHNPDDAATGCNNVITVNADGSITATQQDSVPYEDSEDILVGVVNNSTKPLSFLWLAGGSQGLFGFDGDGMCIYTFVGDGYCTAAQMLGTDPEDYEGPTSSFSNISANQESGIVNFSPAVAPGSSTYFSLEDDATTGCNITVQTAADIIFKDGFEFC